jgi:hypothetical protein
MGSPAGFYAEEQYTSITPPSWGKMINTALSIRPRQVRQVPADTGEDQVGGDWRGLIEAAFAPFSLK